jgi:hypothetical protein
MSIARRELKQAGFKGITGVRSAALMASKSGARGN